MKTVSIISAALIVAPSGAFLGPSAHSAGSALPRSSSVLDDMGEGAESQPVLEYLGVGGMPGDYGWDPLKLADKDLHVFSATDRSMQVIRTEAFADRAPELILRDYRDAEIRHGRLAMMAAVAWPVQEIVAPVLGRFFNGEGISGLSDVLAETGGRSPSVLNGGLEQGMVPFFLFGAAALVGAIDLRSLDLRDAMEDDFVPGDYGFDPLQLTTGMSPADRFDMAEKEINNGRLAMVAVTTYVLEEAVSGKPITELTPWLFNPAYAFPAMRQFLDQYGEAGSAAQRISGEAVAAFVDQIPN